MCTNQIQLPSILRGRNIFTKVIPTVCNLKNMLDKLEKHNFEIEKLRQWEKRSYKEYKIEKIINLLIESPKLDWSNIIRSHILTLNGDEIGASVIDIYIVAYAAYSYGTGRDNMFRLIKEKHISEKVNSSNAIYCVGKGDGIFLGLLNKDGTVKDKEFFKNWIENTSADSIENIYLS
ncbi:hypothetical protein [Clostridium butyricum]|uniref:Uncharacterized protein n=1 Tax=Clostridium butyricum TaxID=1492 RepID=A0A2S7FBH8_CLOBU|nr:hypothetical protein [Clostridium butyricum]KHD16248.1 hypothetical protein OA81_05955 [Clostridium butyricum]PPV15424.1 hypothetical protein AWN73_11635 [Clostridium butyricum]